MQQSRKINSKNFVSFSGIDGAGKSTQIEALRNYFTERGWRVDVVRFWDDVARLKNIRESTGHKVFKGDKGVGSPETPINRRDKNVRSWYMTGVRLFLYTVDAVSLRFAVQKAMRSEADLTIFDRYAYDELANFSLKNPTIRVFVRFIMMIVPRPKISYFLDADPEKARARKPEYPLEFLHVNRAAYYALSNMLDDISIIAPMPVDQVKQTVIGHAVRNLEFSLPEVAADRGEIENVEEAKQLDGHRTHPAA